MMNLYMEANIFSMTHIIMNFDKESTVRFQ